MTTAGGLDRLEGKDPAEENRNEAEADAEAACRERGEEEGLTFML